MAESAAKGHPLARSMWMQFPTDAKAANITTQLTLGADVILAPVLAAGATKVEAYLPAGDWVGLWDGTPYSVKTGIVVQVDVPFGQQAIFLRKGADVTAYVRKNLSQVTMWKCETSQ